MTPTALAMLLFGAVGVAALFAVFDDDDDDSSGPEAPDIPVPPDEGTESDDVVESYDREADEDGVLSTLGGDDLVVLDDLAGVTIDLGEGDDTLEGDGYRDVTIDTGAGDDLVRLDGAEDTTLFTGDGDDVVLLTDPGHSLRLELGAGDDRIVIDDATPSADYSGGDVRWISGGEGSDRYEFTLRPNEEGLPFPDPMTMGHPHAAIISDFAGGVDRLVVDPTTLAGDATYTGYELTHASGTGYLEVVFHYAHPDHPSGLAVSVALTGPNLLGFSEDDLEIVGPAGASQ